MAKTHREEYHDARDAIETAAEEGEIATADAEAVREFLDAKDPNVLTVTDDDDTTKSNATLAQYAYHLRHITTRFDTPLTEAIADGLNQYFSELIEGTHSAAPTDGYASGTVRQKQGIVRKFYRYHDGLGVDPEAIAMLPAQETHVDDRDLYTEAEIEALRDACENPRDRCLLELLIYTGQRIGALLTLRVKDVDPDEDVFWLNGDADGLKGADQRGEKRPLLGAKAAVRSWLQYHPTGDPDDYLLTCLPGKGTASGTPGDRLHYTSAKQRLDKLGEAADIEDKPVTAHMFRHYFVTVAKRDYDLDNDTIKYLLGHAADSSVMETTYAHLTADDFIERAREGAGEIEIQMASPLTPPECHICDEPLEDHWKACPACGERYAPEDRDAGANESDKAAVRHVFQVLLGEKGTDAERRKILRESVSGLGMDDLVADVLGDADLDTDTDAE